MCRRHFLGVSAVLFLYASAAFGQANGKLQIHFMDVGQGDGAVLISPGGEVVLFDNGVRNNCDKPLSYLQQLGITKVDYHIASHYHDDHIGCTSEVLQQFPLQQQAIDRGGTYHTNKYRDYVTAVGSQRRTATQEMTITLDGNLASPVRITVAALNGNGVQTTNENDLSVVAVVRFGSFDAVIGGDLSGYQNTNYEDIETSVASLVGQVEVYKVHHHGSRYSSNDAWLSIVKPKVGIVSTGTGNPHLHPTQDCLERLHMAGVRTYWTELGNGVDPEPEFDIVGGNIIVEVAAGTPTFTVTHNWTLTDTYSLWDSPGAPPEPQLSLAWSRNSGVYHFAACRYVSNINPANLERGNDPPLGKTLHQGCPK